MCYDLGCSAGCCNYYGYCPTNSFNSLYSDCYTYYYYYDVWVYWWIYFVIALSVCVFISIIACIVCCIRRRNIQRSQDTVIINDSPTPYAPYDQSYGNYNNGQNYGYNQGQQMAYMGQPVYNDQSNIN